MNSISRFYIQNWLNFDHLGYKKKVVKMLKSDKKHKILIIIGILFIPALICCSDQKNAKGEATYKEYCATCHGSEHQGGLGESLTDSEWEFGSDDKSIKGHIKNGIDELGMPSFNDVLSDEEIANLIEYIRQEENKNKPKQHETVDIIETFDYNVKVQLFADDLEEPWAIDFISESIALVTEKPGRLRIIKNGKLSNTPVSDIPKVYFSGQGGLLDVAVDPKYSENQWIYLAYSHAIGESAMTKLVRGKIVDNKWEDEETLFAADPKHYINTGRHYGCRIVFDDKGHLLFSIGDRGKRSHAQDITRPNGKIHRINIDGTIPEDNPFIDVDDAYKSIYAYGNRNAQGLAIHPQTGELWETEHAQKGGDELNIIRSGLNYGWDKITYGRNYDGSVSTEEVKLPGMEGPILFWRPSIAVCGLDFYSGQSFSKWKGHLIVGALKYEEVRLLDIEDGRVIHQEILLKDYGRVRDVCTGPDGAIYVVINKPGEILRLTPSE